MLSILRAGPADMTVADVAALFFQIDSYSKGQREQVRRQLNSLHDKGLAHKRAGQGGGKGAATPR